MPPAAGYNVAGMGTNTLQRATQHLDLQLTVEGDVTDLAGAGARFRVVAPVGTDQDSGEAQLDPWTRASRWLWAGYMYEPPLVGYTGASGVERKAPGPDNDPATPDANLKGQYYCWNRTYDIGTGRWTTPDPAASPVTNLQDYVSTRPIEKSDPSGNGIFIPVGIGIGVLAALLLPGSSSSPDLKTDSTVSIATSSGIFRWENTGLKKGDQVYGSLSPSTYSFKLTFTPSPSCQECATIKFVQFARAWSDGTVDHSVSGVYNKSMHLDSEGWFVDTATEGVPYYTRQTFGMSLGGSLIDATMTDEAGAGWGAFNWSAPDKFETEFVSCAICAGKPHKLFGCIKFGLKFEESGWSIVPSLNVPPFLRTESASWWNNDKTVQHWNNIESNDLPTAVD